MWGGDEETEHDPLMIIKKFVCSDGVDWIGYWKISPNYFPFLLFVVSLKILLKNYLGY